MFEYDAEKRNMFLKGYSPARRKGRNVLKELAA
jgi:hypothetical protein